LLGEKIRPSRSRPSSFTLMFIPHSKQSVSSMSIPGWFLKIISVVLVGIVISLIWFGFKYWYMRESIDELDILRSINKKQELKLKSLETEATKLHEQMQEVEFLEKDVRNLLKDGKLANRSGARSYRDDSLSGKGGGPARPETGERKFMLSLLGRPSLGEQSEEWNTRYSTVDNIVSYMSARTGDMKEELQVLKEDVEKRKDYLAARPYGMPVIGNITCAYGYRDSPFSGGTEFHPALDIAASYGTSVVATGKGRVIFAGYRTGYGRTVIIQHAYGFRTMYAHNSSLLVDVGDIVQRGKIISRVGSTGNSTGPHVHYEVLSNGVNVDPGIYS